VTTLTNMISTLTEKEALSVGVFLALLLSTLQVCQRAARPLVPRSLAPVHSSSLALTPSLTQKVWYADEARYRRECSQQTMRQSVSRRGSGARHASSSDRAASKADTA
jgi:hypothetical protein